MEIYQVLQPVSRILTIFVTLLSHAEAVICKVC